MSENERFKVKRFDEYDQVVWDTMFEESCSVEQVVNMLNDKDWVIATFNEENEQLEKSKMEIANDLGKVIDENEQLKMTNNSLKLLVQDWEALDNEKDEQLNKQNQALIELKKEKERWKLIACNNSSFNSILLHELDIAQEQGYKLSDPFKKLMREKND